MLVHKYIYYISSPLRRVEMDVKNGRIVCIGHDTCSSTPPPYPPVLGVSSIKDITDKDVTIYDGVYRVFIEKYSENISPIYVRIWESKYA